MRHDKVYKIQSFEFWMCINAAGWGRVRCKFATINKCSCQTCCVWEFNHKIVSYVSARSGLVFFCDCSGRKFWVTRRIFATHFFHKRMIFWAWLQICDGFVSLFFSQKGVKALYPWKSRFSSWLWELAQRMLRGKQFNKSKAYLWKRIEHDASTVWWQISQILVLIRFNQ